VECERCRRKAELFADLTGRQAIRTGLDEQAVDNEAGLLRERG
jgi:hypothetical protein